MRGDEFLDKMELIDPKLVSAADAAPKKRRSPVKLLIAVAACLCIVVAAVLLSQSDEIRLSDASTATAVYGLDDEGMPSGKSRVEWYDEDELFSDETFQTELCAFRGTVTKLQNITLDYNGYKICECIATVKVTTVYKGDFKVGDEVKLELPYPVGVEVRVKMPNLTRYIKVGIEGIFTPLVWDENSYSERRGAVLMHRDIADCGLPDGFRFMFLCTDDGELIWRHDAYPGAVGSATLDDIEEYVIKMLK